jgi:hypothetical protein
LDGFCSEWGFFPQPSRMINKTGLRGEFMEK